ncbi:hypothetical protein NP233_g1221 [Leucocoprinus birnbaumii]|uniref:Uncharacterized protein n=1 Tax=Leucocoprinus birnbaumii TaxID=56174 RepID=A0AAD5W4F0_9AGAR|nr:hypothetical protein NP233_g1221 [Leucocoprinus birnbaumii]
MALLASFLTNTQEQPPEDADDAQVDELLKRLTAADGVAKGVEERLDGIIDNLDLLLTALEKESGNDAEVPPETGGSDKTKEPSS